MYVDVLLQFRDNFGCLPHKLTWIMWFTEFLSSVPTKKLRMTFFPYLEFSCAIAFSAVQEVPKAMKGEVYFRNFSALIWYFNNTDLTWKLFFKKEGKLLYHMFAPSFLLLPANHIYLVTDWVEVFRLYYQWQLLKTMKINSLWNLCIWGHTVKVIKWRALTFIYTRSVQCFCFLYCYYIFSFGFLKNIWK